RRQRPRHTSKRIHVNLARKAEFLLHRSQRTNITGQQRLIEVVDGSTSAFKIYIHIDPPTRKTGTHAAANAVFERRQFLTESKVDVEIAIVDGLDFNGDGKIFAIGCSPSESSH